MMFDTPENMRGYRRQLDRALENEFLGKALDAFFTAYRANRPNVFSGIDFDAAAAEIGGLKDAGLPEIMERYEAFKQKAEAAGATVLLARDADEANRIIGEICRGESVEKIVKSKSMTAEEIFLNHHLEGMGLEVVETDLGEWIIQLRREGPSHMVMPAIHLSRVQVAELFSRVGGREMGPDDIPGMVRFARKRLRKAYLEADMGISGANFAICRTGSLGLVTNEGNARLVTTLPRVHLALVGLDKLLPDLESALKVLKVLPKNATGQNISSYVTWITGASECRSAKGGRKKMYIVFLDNGRLALTKDPDFSQVLRCVRCGACANTCPVYRQVGGHNYGHVYVGAVGLINTLVYHGKDKARAIVQNCLNCGACRKVCAAGIDLPLLIKKALGRVHELDGQKPAKNRLLSAVLKDRARFHALLRAARKVQAPLAGENGFMRHLPMFFLKQHDFRALPVIMETPLRERWAGLDAEPEKAKTKAALFGGCLVDFVYPGQGEALVGLLRGKQVGLAYPWGQSCCGLPAAMAAEAQTAKDVAIQNIRAIDPDRYQYIVTLCASCASHMKHAYPRLLADEPQWAEKARAFAAKVIDSASFLKDVVGIEPKRDGGGRLKAAYHAPCHLCRGLGVTRAPKELLASPGIEYLPCEEEDVCCGFGGSYSVDFPQLSARILGRKLDNLEATGAEVVLTDCPGCVMQLGGGLKRRESAMKAMHLVEALAGEQSRKVGF